MRAIGKYFELYSPERLGPKDRSHWVPLKVSGGKPRPMLKLSISKEQRPARIHSGDQCLGALEKSKAILHGPCASLSSLYWSVR